MWEPVVENMLASPYRIRRLSSTHAYGKDKQEGFRLSQLIWRLFCATWLLNLLARLFRRQRLSARRWLQQLFLVVAAIAHGWIDAWSVFATEY